MVFISGVHGVGKSHFCKRVQSELGIATFSASQLISEQKKQQMPKDKLIPDIIDNQKFLIQALENLNSKVANYLLDGHLCLLNENGDVTRIGLDTFLTIQPTAMVLLTESSEIIAERRIQRDGTLQDIVLIDTFQKEEILYAQEISETLSIPLKISTGTTDIDNTLDFINSFVGGQ